MKEWLSVQENLEFYNRLRGVALEYVELLHRALGVRDPGFLPFHMVLIGGAGDAPAGAWHIDGVLGALQLILHLTCCSPCTLLRTGEAVTVEDALKFCSPELVRFDSAPLGLPVHPRPAAESPPFDVRRVYAAFSYSRAAASQQYKLAIASPQGPVRWLRENRPEVYVYLMKVKNLAMSRVELEERGVPTGVADAEYAKHRGSPEAASYASPGLAFAMCAEDVHASPPIAGHAIGPLLDCKKCRRDSGPQPSFAIFVALPPALGTQNPDPTWQVSPFHLPGSEEIIPATINDAGRRREQQTKRLCEVALEWRDMDPAGHHDPESHAKADIEWALENNPESEDQLAARLAELDLYSHCWLHRLGFADR